MKVLQIPVGPMANFSYLAVDEPSGEAMVVDSGWELGPIVGAVKSERAKVKYAVATHQHFDHVSTLEELAGKLGAEVVAHQSSPLKAKIRVVDGDSLRLGEASVRVLHTPGHTPDSISLYDGEHVFTGDTLFVGTVGRFERDDWRTIYRSISEAILGLPAETVMFPGHDYGEVKSRTLGEEARLNPFISGGEAGFLSHVG